MKNLENFGVQELNSKEIRETDGGYWWVLQGAIGTFLYEVVNDWENNVAAFKAGEAQTTI